jgi:hypothetical protein
MNLTAVFPTKDHTFGLCWCLQRVQLLQDKRMVNLLCGDIYNVQLKVPFQLLSCNREIDDLTPFVPMSSSASPVKPENAAG